MQLRILLASLFALAAVAAPTRANTTHPKPQCVSGNFDEPWFIKDIFIWEPLPNTTFSANTKATSFTHGIITFHFCDANKGLALHTSCSGVLDHGVAVADNGGYLLCDDIAVAFQLLAGGVLKVERGYTDPCLGSPPYNTGIAFGQNETKMVTQTSKEIGIMMTQAELRVPITAMT